MWQPIGSIPRDGWSYAVMGTDRLGSTAIDIVWWDDGSWESSTRNAGYGDPLDSWFQWWAPTAGDKPGIIEIASNT